MTAKQKQIEIYKIIIALEGAECIISEHLRKGSYPNLARTDPSLHNLFYDEIEPNLNKSERSIRNIISVLNNKIKSYQDEEVKNS